MKIKSLLAYIFIWLISNTLIFAQIDREVNRIYIWDVTYSMKGFVGMKKGEPIIDESFNIWEEVKERIVSSISEIPIDEGKIIIIPFQDVTFDTFTVKASETGIRDAIRYVKGFDTKKMGYTNICRAWEGSFKFIDKEDINFVYLFTDGKQSKFDYPYDKNCLQRFVDQWCKLADDYKDCYTFYISLNENAALSEELQSLICESCPDHLFCSEGTDLPIIEIRPNYTTLHYNLKENEDSKKLSFDFIQDLPDEFRFDMTLESNPYGLSIKNHTNQKIVGREISIDLDFHNGIESFRNQIGTEYQIQLQLNAHKVEGYVIEFTPKKINLIIKNYKEKILNIHVK